MPEALIEAQRNGTLVVFAGAGVSMGTPSNLPSFDDLANEISSGVYQKKKGEQLDAFLGRMAHHIDIQSVTRSILSNPKSQPTRLHHSLLALFSSGERLRVVTTNFDLHFSVAAHGRFGKLEQYSAPALPLGREFTGIVYLHGRLDRQEPLVLADADFGRAYITDGWATRFLTGMFEHYSVLFAGYSHSDPIMNYLARGIVGPSQRFAITHPNDEQRWQALGITPIVVPLRSRRTDKFGAVREAVDAWVARAQMGMLDHELRVQQLLEHQPSLEPDKVDYLRDIFATPNKVQLFAKYANSLSWLKWAEEKGHLMTLFSLDRPSDQVQLILVDWFVREFVVREPQEAIRLIQRNGTILSYALWQTIASYQAHRIESKLGVTDRWVGILLMTVQRGWDVQPLFNLLSKLKAQEFRQSYILLFKFLSTPQLSADAFPADAFLEAFPNDVEVKVRSRISMPLDRAQILSEWSVVSSTLSEREAEHFARWSEMMLVEAASLLRLTGMAGNLDPLTVWRAAIEPSTQDEYQENWTILIDIARDSLVNLSHLNRRKGEMITEEWYNHELTLLSRVALNNMINGLKIDHDIVLRKIEKDGLLYQPELKHEVFSLIAASFPAVAEANQRRFVNYARRAHRQLLREASTEDRNVIDYALYNAAVWLRQKAPNSSAAQELLATVAMRYPEYAPRQMPDFNSWGAGVRSVAHVSPVTSEVLISQDISMHLGMLLDFNPSDRWDEGPTREGLLEEVRRAVQLDTEWSFRLARTLIQNGHFVCDLWQVIFGGWDGARFSVDQWTAVFDLIDGSPELIACVGSTVTTLFRAGVEKGVLDDLHLTKAEQMTESLLVTDCASDQLRDRGSWLDAAINNTAGSVSLFWLYALSRRHRAAGASWAGIPTELRTRFERFLSSNGKDSAFVRTVFCSQVEFLYSIDQDWTVSAIIPQFGWLVDGVNAQQAWHGFLGWGVWNDALFDAMQPSLLNTFAKLSDVLENQVEALSERLAAVAVLSNTTTSRVQWIVSFLIDAPKNAHAAFAGQLRKFFGRLERNASELAWNSWVREYWTRRNVGLPRKLSVEETAQMAFWPLYFPSVFPEAVTLVEAMHPKSIIHGSFYVHFASKQLIEEFPNDAIRLLDAVLSVAHDVRFSDADIYQIALRALSRGAQKNGVMRIANRLAELGSEKGMALKLSVGRS